MAVKVKKLRGSYYIVIDHKGQRKTKKVGGTLEFARGVARQVEAKLTLGDYGILADEKSSSPLFSEYVQRWLEKHIEITSKPATFRLYSWLTRNHLTPHFGEMHMDAITHDQVEDFVYQLATEKENGKCVNAQTTIKVTLAALRSFFTYARKHKVITTNPASCLGNVAKSEKEEREVISMTSGEVELFLESVMDICPEQYPMFLTALRTGMRRGEFLGLKWGDCVFGKNENDPHRYFRVNRTFSDLGYGLPKTKCSRRRVDMSRQLRGVLLELRDKKLLAAMQIGKEDISGDPLFCDAEGNPLSPNNIERNFMRPVCKAAGLRRFTPHCLRHTFAVLMIQNGAPLKYVSEQMGHSSITITANVYGRLQPGQNVGQLDCLDDPQASANGTQTLEMCDTTDEGKVIDITHFRGTMSGSRDLIECYKKLIEDKEITGYRWDKDGQLRPNPQTRRKREGGSE